MIERLLSVRGWKSGDERAPHKPLLLLLALAEVRRGNRWLTFGDVSSKLGTLLEERGPPRSAVHPEYPFWRLRSDARKFGGLWTIPEESRLQPNASGDVTRRQLLEADARGGFTDELATALRTNPELVDAAARAILDDNFEPSLHEDILDAVGLEWQARPSRRPRDPEFRDRILTIYNRRCAVCGYDGRIGRTELAIEAAHLRWHAADGPDAAENGVALCAFHHKALDRGALGLSADRRILVSGQVSGDEEHLGMWLYRFSGSQLRPPQPGKPAPAAAHIAWHRAQVFRGEPRAIR